MFGLFKKGLTQEQRAFWDKNGYLILRGAVSEKEVDLVLDTVDQQWNQRDGNDHVVDVLSGEYYGREFRVADVPQDSRQEVYKLNNLFARVPAIRQVSYNRTILSALVDLLDGEPMICNSLNFERGSQQDYHLDTWYMPPPVDNMMAVASIALEDVDADNGPLTYYPGSHLIPPYRFSNGKLNIINEEAPTCNAYLRQEILQRGLVAEEFRGKKGDVFIWHAQLLHGGRPIKDFNRTRKSLVVHYWRKKDMEAGQFRTDGHGAYIGQTLRGEISY